MIKRLNASGKPGLWIAGAVLAVLAVAPYASASTVRINFSGTAGSGYADLTLAPDPNSSSSYQPTYDAFDGAHGISAPLSAYDPAGAQYITGATGRFNGIPITGVMAVDQGQAPPGEILPNSFSWIYANSTPGLASALGSYDNLFYMDGSPLVCPPKTAGGGVGYPFSGGFLDIYGVMFSLGNNPGDFVGLWSDGIAPPGANTPLGGLTYGMNVYSPNPGGGYLIQSSQFTGVAASVPAPNFLWLFGAGLLGLFAWRRSAEVRKAARRID